MSWLMGCSAAAALGLAVYLVYALLHPEEF
ncbi:MAG: K(+)-transporting ATPase subunit F [Burkholderiaceae bacterium]|nr:K(+)-transporting ATPase subunit F [Burkholderiaceae bacterium]